MKAHFLLYCCIADRDFGLHTVNIAPYLHILKYNSLFKNQEHHETYNNYPRYPYCVALQRLW
jgi:hypothetical protein